MLYTVTLRRCGRQGYWYSVHDRVYHAKGFGVLFSLGLQRYCRFISLGTVHSTPLSAYSNYPGVVLDGSKAAKLGQTGLDFVADARVSRLKETGDDNNEVYWLIQFDKCRTQID